MEDKGADMTDKYAHPLIPYSAGSHELALIDNGAEKLGDIIRE